MDGQRHFHAVEGEAQMAVKIDGVLIVLEHPQGHPVIARSLDGGEQPPHDIGSIALACGFRPQIQGGQLQGAGQNIFVPGIADGDVAHGFAVCFDQIGAVDISGQQIHPVEETPLEGIVFCHVGGGENMAIGLPAVYLDAGQFCGVVHAGLAQINHGWSPPCLHLCATAQFYQ